MMKRIVFTPSLIFGDPYIDFYNQERIIKNGRKEGKERESKFKRSHAARVTTNRYSMA